MNIPHKLKLEIYSILKSEIGTHKEVSLAIFPNHWNVGDSAIWWATCIALTDLGIKIRYVCSFKSYKKGDLNRYCPDGPILLCGGGNFGDLYMDEQGLREKIITDHPDKKIVQLPQSIWFNSDSERMRIADIVKSHPNFSLLVRDRQSLEIAKSLAVPNVTLCPDMAFCLDGNLGLLQSNTPAFQLTVLKRDDGESNDVLPPNLSEDTRNRVYDWHQETKDYKLSWPYLAKFALLIITHWTNWSRIPMRLLIWATSTASKVRTIEGIRTINESSVVITDRLHAGILSALVHQPTILVDNSYGKNSMVYAAWMSDMETIQIADNFSTALRLSDEIHTKQ